MRNGIKLRAAGLLKEGEWVQFNFQKWYRMQADAKEVAGWAFLKLEGHPLSVCTIWHTVEQPCLTGRPGMTAEDLPR